ncbi:MAG: aminoacyl--tRNA ligase-related protein [Patescibacteria group bacterium]|nr:aminoacyl--tRNA ligase-related protein [Patescibacteria group bacterium]
MKQSLIFSKTLKQAPKDEQSVNARLLTRAGFIDKLSAGIYSFLPFGLRVCQKIENIVRQEMNEIGAQEILMPVLQPKSIWDVTGRWQKFAGKEMFKLKNQANKDYTLGWTHEEVITPLMQKFVLSRKDFPVFVYQIQDKFRDEIRAKSGILRTREFIMKDLYSFHTSENDLDKYYEKVKKAYFRIFKKIGIDKQTYLCLASGGSFSKYSHEFQTITSAGEDVIYICENCGMAINKEIKTEHLKCPECGKTKFRQEKAIEIGNIFKLGTNYTKPFDFKFIDKDGTRQPVIMGCYGLGITRMMGAVVEVFNDANGIVWPENIAPYQIHLIQVGDDLKVKETAEKIYKGLLKQGKEVLYDDRKDKRPGEKFADADLIGIPLRMVVSKKTVEKNSVEIKYRNKNKVELAQIKELGKLGR